MKERINMKTVRQKRKIVLAMAALLAVFCLFASPLRAVDTTKMCSLNIAAAGQDDTVASAELSAVSVSARLYRVAVITPTYYYKATGAFAALAAMTDADGAALKLHDYKTFTATQMQFAAEQAAALAANAEPAKSFAFENGKASLSGLQTGLYLLVTDTTDTGAHIYTFSPVLLSLPSMSEDDGSDLYDVSGVVLKPARTDALTSVNLQKTLSSYSTLQGPATFVFQVEAVKDGKPVYSNVVSMVFDATGTKTVNIPGLPVGAAVTATEVYSGASYAATTATAQTVTLAPEKQGVATLAFENGYDHRNTSGSSITNMFDKGATSWNWSQAKDSTT